jgi:hypothetical protein
VTAFHAIDPTGKPQWRKVYEALSGRPYGDVVSYDEIRRVAGIDLRLNRSPVYRATREMEEADARTIEAVPGVGYRIVEPTEHERLAHARRRFAGRQMRRSVAVIRATNMALVPPEQATYLRGLENWAVAVEQAIVASHRRHDQTERRIEAIERQLGIQTDEDSDEQSE